MDLLQKFDENVFHFINRTLSNPVTDAFMPFITERNHWFIFYALIWIYLVIKGGTRGRVSAVLIIILILISDQFSDNILKPFFHRIRPCHVLPDVNLLTGCSDAFAFPSNHAVNNFAAATLFSFFYPDMKYILFTAAIIVSSSRIFVGVHYPFDVVGGAFIGICFALLIIFLWKQVNKKINLIQC